MELIGIIDLGSNSVRLVIIEISDNGAHHQIENLKETVRLGASVDAKGMLLPEAMDYTTETIRLFANLCKVRKVDHIIAVATAAVRRANNRQVLLDRLKQETGISFQVLSGEEEAHLGYIGLVNTMPQPDGLMADLGGGSLRLVSFANRIKEQATSQRFGTLTLTKQFQLADKPTSEHLAKLEEFLTSTFTELPWIIGKEPIIGLGGAFRSLARIARKRKGYLPDITDAFEIDVDEIGDIFRTLSGMNQQQRLAVPGLEQARADLSVAGAAVIYYLLKVSGRQKLVTSTSSIRDGLLHQYLSRHTGDPFVLSAITHHIDNLIHHYNLDEDHLRRVSNLAVTLFDQLDSIHDLDAYARRLLLIAGLLHEIGVVISVEARDKHTLYMLLNGRLQGLTHRERVIVAYVAASHDGLYLTNIDEYLEHGPLKTSDVVLIRKLSAILQITHSLDRCHTGVVTQVKSSTDEKSCVIQVLAKSGAELEIKDARRRAQAFADIFGYKLSIQQR